MELTFQAVETDPNIRTPYYVASSISLTRCSQMAPAQPPDPPEQLMNSVALGRASASPTKADDALQVDFEFTEEGIAIECRAKTVARTGVEMEALTGVSVAALTIYDMCKAVDRGMTIEAVRLEEKSGGNSGHFVRDAMER